MSAARTVRANDVKLHDSDTGHGSGPYPCNAGYRRVYVNPGSLFPARNTPTPRQ